MLACSEPSTTPDAVRASLRKHLGHPGGRKPEYDLELPSNTSNRLTSCPPPRAASATISPLRSSP